MPKTPHSSRNLSMCDFNSLARPRPAAPARCLRRPRHATASSRRSSRVADNRPARHPQLDGRGPHLLRLGDVDRDGFRGRPRRSEGRAARPADLARLSPAARARAMTSSTVSAVADDHDQRRRLAEERRVDRQTRRRVPSRRADSRRRPMPPRVEAALGERHRDPPSDTSCADLTSRPPPAPAAVPERRARGRDARAGAVRHESTRAVSSSIHCRRARRRSRQSARLHRRPPLNARPTTVEASSISPTMPMTGVGRMARPSVSL